MRKGIQAIGVIVLTLIMTGCGQANLGNSYNEGTDHQYMYDERIGFLHKQAKGENGYFFYHDNFLYYRDSMTEEFIPLCNRVDCLHDEETDMERRVTCNAYVGYETGSDYPADVGISYYDGYLYFIAEDTPSHSCLQRIKEDGTNREKVYDFGDAVLYGWCIHRGALYYSEQTYTTEEIFKINKLTLSGKKKLETIYEPDRDNVTVYSLGARITAYGDYVFFSSVGTKGNSQDEITQENYADYAFDLTYAYNLENGELSEIKAPDTQKNTYLGQVSFWKEHLVFVENTWGEDWTGKSNLYIADLDGQNAEKLLETEGGMYVDSDGTYLYLNNEGRYSAGVDEAQRYWVYGDNMELVDSFQVSRPRFNSMPVGDENGLCYCADDENVWRLIQFDKSDIGTINGEELSGKVLAERKKIAVE